MATIPRTAEQHQEVVDAYHNNNCKKANAARAIGIPEATFKSRYWRAVQLGYKPKSSVFAPVTPTIITAQQRDLQERLSRAEKQLREIERDNLKAEAIRREIFGLAASQPTEPKWINERSEFDYKHGIPTLMLSDLHHGEVVYPDQVFGCNEFNAEISERRIQRVFDTTIHLTKQVLNAPDYSGIVLVLGGDLINGDLHDETSVGSDRRIMRQAIEIADIIHQGIKKLLLEFPRVFVVGVAGNHGRTTKKPWAKFYAETNFDWLVMQMIERFMQPDVIAGRLQFLSPPAPDVTYKVAGRRFRLTHGDQFRGGDGVIGFLGPVTRGNKKKQSMALSLPTDNEHYDTMLIGHFHQLHMTPYLIANGSTKGYDEYALRCNFAYEPPQQALFLTHPEYGINHYLPVLADEPKKIKHVDWVSWQKRQA